MVRARTVDDATQRAWNSAMPRSHPLLFRLLPRKALSRRVVLAGARFQLGPSSSVSVGCCTQVVADSGDHLRRPACFSCARRASIADHWRRQTHLSLARILAGTLLASTEMSGQVAGVLRVTDRETQLKSKCRRRPMPTQMLLQACPWKTPAP